MQSYQGTEDYRIQCPSNPEFLLFPVALFGVVLVAEKALHMALLVVHAIPVSRKILWTMAFNTVGDFFRRRPFCPLPSS